MGQCESEQDTINFNVVPCSPSHSHGLHSVITAVIRGVTRVPLVRRPSGNDKQFTWQLPIELKGITENSVVVKTKDWVSNIVIVSVARTVGALRIPLLATRTESWLTLLAPAYCWCQAVEYC